MPAQPLSIVMYHYVRPVKGSRYPKLAALELDAFVEQIDYLQRYYEIVPMRRVIAAIEGVDELPRNAALLTFDDGYIDHLVHATRVLAKKKATGAFFVPGVPILEGRVLDVNKIQFALASVSDPAVLVDSIDGLLEEARGSYVLEPTAAYHERFRAAWRFDNADTIYVKRMLQHALPEPLRIEIADTLFRRHVSADEGDFARQLYLSLDDCRAMIGEGMHIGSHGYNHQWLGHMSAEAQRIDIVRSMELLDRLDIPKVEFTLCYPFGSHNGDTLAILGELGCKMAVTTVVREAAIGADGRFELPRFDTNHFPKVRDAKPPGPGSWPTVG